MGDIEGSIRINPKNYNDGFISDPNGGPDIYIEGMHSRNTAMDGDLVRVRLNNHSKWKLNQNAIADKWDIWSQYLIPIIETIESQEKFEEAVKNVAQNNDIALGSNGKSSTRVKRDTSNLTENKTKSIKKSSPKTKKNLPSNLPSGISKLKIEHIQHLPIFDECIQKTGSVVEILKRNHSGIAGGFLHRYSPEFARFSPTDPRVPRMLIDIRECPLDFTTSDRYKNVLFVAQLMDWNGKEYATGSLVKIIGDCNSIQSRIETLLIENQIYDSDFPPDAYAELEYLKNLPGNWFEDQCKNRRDLTNDCVFTIDPKTARDLDDAVSIKRIAEQIYEVGVHIADVSNFVKELSAVDYYARLRTTSVYLVDRVIPMLPRILCEQMCSLNPNESKLTFSVIWKMDKYGRIIDQWFGRTYIKSCCKLSYEQAQDLIEKNESIDWIEEDVNMPRLYNFNWRQISRSVILLNKIAQNLRAKRYEDGALKIEQVKIKFELDSGSGFPTGLAIESRQEANFLIEEFMLLANMSVAKRIYDYNNDFAFLRRHPPSCGNLLKDVKEFCDAKGLSLDITDSGSIQKSINSINDTTMAKVVSFLLLRAMKNAEYICVGSLPRGDANFRHFALNVPFYTHFTSPIRRYADIIVHRQLALSLGYERESNEEVLSLSRMADECTRRKISSKIISDGSQKLYFNLFVQKAGFCELLACVTRIYDQYFDVILVDYDRQGRVYLDKLKQHLEKFTFESFKGVKRIVLDWKTCEIKPDNVESKSKSKRKKKKKHNAQPTQMESRLTLESKKFFCDGIDYRINEARNNKQVIEVFDVIRVIVSVDNKDITLLKIDLKVPEQ